MKFLHDPLSRPAATLSPQSGERAGRTLRARLSSLDIFWPVPRPIPAKPGTGIAGVDGRKNLQEYSWTLGSTKDEKTEGAEEEKRAEIGAERQLSPTLCFLFSLFNCLPGEGRERGLVFLAANGCFDRPLCGVFIPFQVSLLLTSSSTSFSLQSEFWFKNQTVKLKANHYVQTCPVGW